MVRTPWGDAGSLRERKLAPGSRLPAAAVARNQRERLFAAMVATVAEKGYEATRVEDLVGLSGVSRSAFYRHFTDKQDCFLGAVDAMAELAVATIASGDGAVGEERAQRVLDAFVGLIVDQPAGARMCFVEVYAAGPEAVRRLERATGHFEGFAHSALEQMPERRGTPAILVRGIVGGLRELFHTRLYREEAGRLLDLMPQLLEWGLAYPPPPEPLRPPRRRAPTGAPAIPGDPVDRILRATAAAVADVGYPETTVADIVSRASTSQSTFYANFPNREEALLAALDQATAQMLAATLPAFRRTPDWPQAVRAAFEALFAFTAAEPEFTRLAISEVYTAGQRALEHRDQVMRTFEGLLKPGYELAPDASPIAPEAIGGAVYTLMYDQMRESGPESLPQITHLATYLALAPFVGARQACAVANGAR